MELNWRRVIRGGELPEDFSRVSIGGFNALIDVVFLLFSRRTVVVLRPASQLWRLRVARTSSLGVWTNRLGIDILGKLTA